MIESIKRSFKIFRSFLSGKKYGIRAGYIHRIESGHFDDSENEDQWQKEVYQFGADLSEKQKYKTILDIGCGSGYKLLKYFNDYETTGCEIEPTLSFLKNTYPTNHWEKLEACFAQKYDLIIISDVIEHVKDPESFLSNIIDNIEFKQLIISTPERDLLNHSTFGPPLNTSHFREWTMKEFGQFISAFLIVEKHHISNQSQCTQMVLGSPKK